MLQLLLDYSFITVALGTIILACSTSVIGSINILTKQSLVGDALGHSTYPGVLFAFLVFRSRSVYLLTIGAVCSGYIAYFLVYWLRKNTRHSYVNILAIVSSGFFSLGMVLQTLLQHFPHLNSSKAGLKQYILGQAAFIQLEDIILIAIVSIICLSLFFIFYQQYRLFLFDKLYAEVVGVPVKFLEHLTIFMTIMLISIGIKTVGIILISSFLIAPAITGLFVAKDYGTALKVSVCSGCISSLLGTYFSSFITGLSTGPSIILWMSLFCAFAYYYHATSKKGKTL